MITIYTCLKYSTILIFKAYAYMKREGNLDKIQKKSSIFSGERPLQLVVFLIWHKPGLNIKVLYLFIKLCCFVVDCTRRFLLFASHNQSPSQESLMPRFAWSLPSSLGRAIPPPALPIGKPSLWRTQCVAPSLANFGQRLLIRTHQQRHHCQDDQQW